jgi:hypothetical protein
MKVATEVVVGGHYASAVILEAGDSVEVVRGTILVPLDQPDTEFKLKTRVRNPRPGSTGETF